MNIILPCRYLWRKDFVIKQVSYWNCVSDACHTVAEFQVRLQLRRGCQECDNDVAIHGSVPGGGPWRPGSPGQLCSTWMLAVLAPFSLSTFKDGDGKQNFWLFTDTKSNHKHWSRLLLIYICPPHCYTNAQLVQPPLLGSIYFLRSCRQNPCFLLLIQDDKGEMSSGNIWR